MARFEVFNPADGHTLFTVRGELLARFACYLALKLRGTYLDYAKPGEGW
jgi:hypothetical protein